MLYAMSRAITGHVSAANKPVRPRLLRIGQFCDQRVERRMRYLPHCANRSLLPFSLPSLEFSGRGSVPVQDSSEHGMRVFQVVGEKQVASGNGSISLRCIEPEFLLEGIVQSFSASAAAPAILDSTAVIVSARRGRCVGRGGGKASSQCTLLR